MSKLTFVGHHGDVTLFRADKLPEGLKEIQSLVLHKGEGVHVHQFTNDSDVYIGEDKDGNRWFSVGAGGATITHEEHQTQVFPPGTVFKTVIERSYNPYTKAIEAVQD